MTGKNKHQPNNRTNRVPTKDSGIAQDSAILPRRRIGNINNTYVSPVQRMTNPPPPPKKK